MALLAALCVALPSTSADALPVLQRPEVRELFERQGVLSGVELESRFEVYSEQYVLAIEVEARLVLRIARTMVYPAVMTYLDSLASSLRNQEALGLQPDRSLANSLSSLSQQLLSQCIALEQAIQHPPHDSHLRHCADTLLPLMGEIRASVDGLEPLIDDAAWPLPTYQEMLFMR
ncbi:MAG: hypothetical protein VKJ66_01175 [Synechococcus sp.]|nr:hypothetical protein [Synechococcus sp.]